jgi:tetratricopeptide (TPR) repeat protein
LEQLRGLEQAHKLIRSYDGNFKFDHGKIKEVLYREIPKELRMEYHSVIANTIENMNKGNLDEVTGDLAFHYYQCKNKDKALHYLIKAAEKAMKEYSNEEAIKFYSESLELVESEDERARILDGLGEAYELVGAYDKSIKVHQELLKLLVDGESAARVSMKIARQLEKKGAHQESVSVLEEALSDLENKESSDIAMVLAQLGHVYMLRSDYDTALQHLHRSLEISRRLNDCNGIATALCAIGEIRWVRRELDSALPPLLESLEIREKDGPLKELCETRDIIGFVHMHRGDLLQALEHLGYACLHNP